MINERSAEKKDLKGLITKALDMRRFSYVPYSHFHVGAALLAKNGRVYGGCNIENASYGVSNCAERTALFQAVSEGVTEFDCIVITGGPEEGPLQYCAPCAIRRAFGSSLRNHRRITGSIPWRSCCRRASDLKT